MFTNLKVNAAKEKKTPSVLLLLDEAGANTKLALRNIDFLRFNLATDTNVYEVLANKKLIITKDGLTKLTNRLKK